MGASFLDIQEGGYCYVRTRFRGNDGSDYKTKHAIVLEKERGAAVVKTLEDGKVGKYRFSNLLPDEEWLAQQDERDKKKWLDTERAVAVEKVTGAFRVEEAPQPSLKASLGEQLAVKKVEPKVVMRPSAPAPAPVVVKEEDPMPKHSSNPVVDIRRPRTDVPAPVPSPEEPSMSSPSQPAPVASVDPQNLAGWINDVVRSAKRMIAPAELEIEVLTNQIAELETKVIEKMARKEDLQKQIAKFQLLIASSEGGAE